MRTRGHEAPILEIMTTDEATSAPRTERVLAVSVVSTIGLSLFTIVAVLIATGIGVRNFDSDFWHVVLVLPVIGLPLGVLLIVTLLVVNFVRRQRENARSK